MIKKKLDLHVHSKYSRACSPQLEVPGMARVCAQKGIDIVATGDFTHPAWLAHLQEQLEEENEGVYRLKTSGSKQTGSGTRFIVGTEISCIYRHRDKTRRLHLLIFAPNLEVAQKFNRALEKRGANLTADGRPIMGLSAKEILKICLETDERMLLVPAHAWTPWFAVFGSKSGYDSLAECFEELTPHVRAIETGLSSDPPMNHRLSALDPLTLISNSDAHSLNNLGREANVFAFERESEISYREIRRIIAAGDRKKFLYTIEFYPEEGKYHYDGHAACGVSLKPSQTKREKFLCPTCQRPLTVGVLHRVDDLADRSEAAAPGHRFIPHRSIVPLRQIIAATFKTGVGSKRVAAEYERLLERLGSEFHVLLEAEPAALASAASDPAITLAIANVRAGRVKTVPGYDGVYGVVDVFGGKPLPRLEQKTLL